MNFNTDPPVGKLSTKLTQLDFALKPIYYRFEILCDPSITGSVSSIIGRPLFDAANNIIERIDLKINPNQYEVSEPVRQAITQTKSGAWIDFYGPGLSEVNMKGTTGWKPRTLPATKSNPLAAQAIANAASKLAALSGATTPNTPTGLQDFIALRNRIFRTYNVLLKNLKLDFSKRLQAQVQLRFYAWDTEDYFIVQMNHCKLQRNASRPMLYDYDINMTVVGYPQNRGDITDFLVNYYKPQARATNILTQLQNAVAYFQQIESAILSVSAAVNQEIQSVTSDITTLVDGVQNLVTGAADVIDIPLATVQAIASSLRQIGDDVLTLEQLPQDFINEVRAQVIETVCACYALATYPKLFQNSWQAKFANIPWGNLTCSSTLGIPPSPTDNSQGTLIPADNGQPANPPLTSVTPPGSPLAVTGVNSSTQASQPYRLKEVQIAEGDSIESILLKTGGTDPSVASVWQQIAVINGLEYPYIAPNAEFDIDVEATGVVSFSGTPGTAIPAGTRVAVIMPNGGTPIVFDTMAQATIGSNGLTSVGIIAENPGAYANVLGFMISAILDPLGNIITLSGVTAVENPNPTTGGKIWAVLTPGMKLKIPVILNQDTQEPYLERSVPQVTSNDLFGIDFFLDATGDIVADPTGDAQTIAGIANMQAAVTDRLEADKGELTKHPEYGFNVDRIVGEPLSVQQAGMAKIEVSSTLLADPRIKSIQNVTVVGITVEESMNISMTMVLIDEVSRSTGLTVPLGS